MPNLPISQLPQSSTLQGDELFVNVQGGVTKYTTLDDIHAHHEQHLSIYSSGSQSLISPGSGQPVTFSSVWSNESIYLEGNNKIVLPEAGTYKLNFGATLANFDNAVHDGWFWIKYNGENFPNSAKRITLQPRKNSSTPSAQLMSLAIIGIAQNNNDYIELYWTGDSNLVTLRATPGSGDIPDSPSIISSVIRVG